MTAKLVQLPQCKAVLDITKLIALGEVQPGKFVAVMEGSNHGTLMPLGDHNALIEELKRRGVLEELQPVAAANEGKVEVAA